jgi:ureidoglycolate lyase
MARYVLKPLPLTPERFAPFGDVISTSESGASPMNEARFDRFDALARAETDPDGDIAISIVRSREPTPLPYRFDTVERHPLGSQAFIPLSPFEFLIVVGAAGESVEPGDLRAFVTNGKQGVNYCRGTWHMPLIATGRSQAFLVVDRTPMEGNCEERVFDEPVVLESPG